MDHDYLKFLLKNPAVRLLRLENAPLIISFLFHQFKISNRITITSNELITNLSDYLYHLREQYGEDSYPGTAEDYLEKWSNEGYLRKYYLPEGDLPVFELTPATEKALNWINDLDKKEFVGTESRLLKIFEILKELAYKNSDDPEKRVKELEKQKLLIEQEIEKTQAGILDKLNETQIKERFYEVYDTALKLLSDFREIEYNFRELDNDVRQKQLNSQMKKGRLLDDIFKVQDLIWDSDQGRSFKAFWEFLMSQSKKDELNDLLEYLNNLHEIKEIKKDDVLNRFVVNLIEAGDKVNKTNHRLVEQLRRFLDDKSRLENKRIIELILEIKTLALQSKDRQPQNREFLPLDDKPLIRLIMERSLWHALKAPDLSAIDLVEGDAEFVDTEALYRQLFIDPEELKKRIRVLLKTENQVTLKQITAAYPVQKGLLEIITYLMIASSRENNAVFADDRLEVIAVANLESGNRFEIKLPQVIFSKS